MKLRTAILVISYLLCTGSVFGQSCAMCYGSAKSTTQEGKKAINKAVLVLLLPPVSCLTLGVWLAFRYGRRRDLEQGLSLGLVDASLSPEEALRSGSPYKPFSSKGFKNC